MKVFGEKHIEHFNLTPVNNYDRYVEDSMNVITKSQHPSARTLECDCKKENTS